MKNLFRVAGFSVVMTVVFPVTTIAQSSGASALEEIVVTATRRAESIQDVPIAVTALSSKQLERSGARDVRGN